MSGTTTGSTTPSVGSQTATALQGTMDSASIARLVQQLLQAQNSASQATANTSGTQQQASTQGMPSTTGTTASGGTSISGMQASDYATMMQQMLSLLYGRQSGNGSAQSTAGGSSGASDTGGAGG